MQCCKEEPENQKHKRNCRHGFSSFSGGGTIPPSARTVKVFTAGRNSWGVLTRRKFDHMICDQMISTCVRCRDATARGDRADRRLARRKGRTPHASGRSLKTRTKRYELELSTRTPFVRRSSLGRRSSVAQALELRRRRRPRARAGLRACDCRHCGEAPAPGLAPFEGRGPVHARSQAWAVRHEC